MASLGHNKLRHIFECKVQEMFLTRVIYSFVKIGRAHSVIIIRNTEAICLAFLPCKQAYNLKILRNTKRLKLFSSLCLYSCANIARTNNDQGVCRQLARLIGGRHLCHHRFRQCLAPARHQAINKPILTRRRAIGSLRINYSEIWVKIQFFLHQNAFELLSSAK